MLKIIDDDLTFYFKNRFPYLKVKNTIKAQKSNIVIIGIGGNIGNVQKRFNQLFLMLQGDSRFIIEQTSPILKNPPFGFLDQEYFYNAIVVLRTTLSPIESLNAFQRYELRFKRTRSFQDAPRTLDIDIIFYNSTTINIPRLIIPHKGYKNRKSVLLPLSYITKRYMPKYTYGIMKSIKMIK